MISVNKVIEEFSKHKYSLFKTFFPKSKYNFNLKKVKKFEKFETIIVIVMEQTAIINIEKKLISDGILLKK